MPHLNNFADKLIPKTPEQVKKEEQELEKSKKRAEQLAQLESLKPMKVLTEDLKKVTDKFFNIPYQTVLKQTLELTQPLTEQNLIEQIELADPLVLKDGKISIDTEKLMNLFSQQNAVVVNNTLEKIRQENFQSNSISGGGGLSVRFEDIDGNQTSLLKSVNTLIFKGDGVTLDKQRKNILVNIPGASVVAGDPTIDFARESTVLEMYSNLQTIYTLLQTIAGINYITNYNDGIGGSTTYWQAY